MMGVLYRDELRGFFRSKVMLALWIGLPVLTLVVRAIRPDTEGMPLVILSAILIGSIGGTLSAVLLATTVTNERVNRVYDLFLIRPVRRGTLLLAKYFAALTALLGAATLSLAVGLLTDLIAGHPVLSLLDGAAQPLVLSVSAMAIATAVGLLFGVIFDSVAASAILAVYLGNQLSAVAILPAALLEGSLPTVIAVAAGTVVPAAVLAIAIAVFRRKTL